MEWEGVKRRQKRVITAKDSLKMRERSAWHPDELLRKHESLGCSSVCGSKEELKKKKERDVSLRVFFNTNSG